MSQILNLLGQPIQSQNDAQPALTIVPQNKTSFTQDERHATKSAKFVPLQPSHYADVLNRYGYKLVSLKSGHARNPDRAAHQTTIATYQKETPMAVGDVFARITLKIPHLYGAAEIFNAFLRLACLNGAAIRLSGTDRLKVRHTGDALSQFETGIAAVVSQTDAMNDSIREMMARNVTPAQVADFVRQSAILRLGQAENISSIQYGDLMRVRRSVDSNQDAFTVYNVVQENLMRFGLRYVSNSVDTQGNPMVRHMTARPILRQRGGEIETVRSVDLNVSLWDAAQKILMGA
jgi:hypothetical protein